MADNTILINSFIDTINKVIELNKKEELSTIKEEDEEEGEEEEDEDEEVVTDDEDEGEEVFTDDKAARPPADERPPAAAEADAAAAAARLPAAEPPAAAEADAAAAEAAAAAARLLAEADAARLPAAEPPAAAEAELLAEAEKKAAEAAATEKKTVFVARTDGSYSLATVKSYNTAKKEYTVDIKGINKSKTVSESKIISLEKANLAAAVDNAPMYKNETNVIVSRTDGSYSLATVKSYNNDTKEYTVDIEGIKKSKTVSESEILPQQLVAKLSELQPYISFSKEIDKYMLDYTSIYNQIYKKLAPSIIQDLDESINKLTNTLVTGNETISNLSRKIQPDFDINNIINKLSLTLESGIRPMDNLFKALQAKYDADSRAKNNERIEKQKQESDADEERKRLEQKNIVDERAKEQKARIAARIEAEEERKAEAQAQTQASRSSLEGDSGISDTARKYFLYKLGLFVPGKDGKNRLNRIGIPLTKMMANNISSTLPNGFEPDVFFTTLFKESKNLIQFPIVRTTYSGDEKKPPEEKPYTEDILNATLQINIGQPDEDEPSDSSDNKGSSELDKEKSSKPDNKGLDEPTQKGLPPPTRLSDVQSLTPAEIKEKQMEQIKEDAQEAVAEAAMEDAVAAKVSQQQKPPPPP